MATRQTRKIERREAGDTYVSNVEEMPDEESQPSDDMIPLAEGGMLVAYDGLEEDPDAAPEMDEQSPEFDDNLAEELSETDQHALGMNLKEFVEVDLESRIKWEQRMADGLEIIGIEDMPEDAAAFVGASRVNYPGLAEAMIQFQARAMEELMPPGGPVKAGIIGKSNDELEAQRERVEDYMNYQLTEEDDEYYVETDSMLLALPYAGSAFKKVAIDPITGRTRSRYVSAIDFIVPYSATSLKTAPRYTHRYTMSYNTFRRAVESGYFIDCEFQRQQPQSDQPRRKMADASDDRNPSYHPEDHDLEFYETTIDLDLGLYGYDDEKLGKRKFLASYAVTFEWETNRVVRIARVWNENDERCERDVWYTHYRFLPGFGFYGIGYLHIIGGLTRAASGALRLILDGSAMASLQGGFKSIEARAVGDVMLEPGKFKEVDMTADELAKAFYAPPFKGPQEALFRTLDILVNSHQRFTSTTEAVVGDAKNTGPVGTTVALIEQGSKVLSGIHRRLHIAARHEFKLIAACNLRFMEEDEYPFNTSSGEKKVFKKDFSSAVDVVPVSDPNIFSSTQRIAIAQAGLQMVETAPQLYDIKAQRKMHRHMLKALRYPDADEILPEDTVRRMDPVSENVSMLNAGAVQVFLEQDDESHLAVHGAFEQEIMGMDPEIQQRVLPILKAHKASHFAQAYRKRIEQELVQTYGIPLPPFDPNDPESYEELPPDIENAVARAASQYAPPPPPPAPEEAAEDQLAAREADRKDMQAQRDEDRKDMQAEREAKRTGLISDVE